MKIFQIVGNIVHYDMTHLYSSLEAAKSKYPATTQIVEAPDYVFEGWGFNPNEIGDNRFVRPEPPEGWEYDEATGTFYNPSLSIQNEIGEANAQLAASDYKVIKCYEYSLVGLDMPYDIEELHAERESLRAKIEELETQLPVAPDDSSATNAYGITNELLEQIKNDTVTEIEEAVTNGTDE